MIVISKVNSVHYISGGVQRLVQCYTQTYPHASKNTSYGFYVQYTPQGTGEPVQKFGIGPTQGGPDNHNFVCVCSPACISFHTTFYDLLVCLI